MAARTRSPGSAPGTKTIWPSGGRASPSPPATTLAMSSSMSGTTSLSSLGMAARPILIAPSVLPADFARLGDECLALEKAGVDRIQWDVMDGQFVPNLTFGPDVVASCRAVTTVPFEAHLMVLTPDVLVERWVEAGCER